MPQDSLDPKAKEFARELIRELLKTKTQEELEPMLGISQGQISRLASTTPGLGTSSRVLMKAASLLGREEEAYRLLKGDDLITAVGVFVDDNEDRYPNRALAIRYARDIGYSEEAIADVAEADLEEPNDPPVKWWIEKIQELDRAYANPFARKEPPGRRDDRKY